MFVLHLFYLYDFAGANRWKALAHGFGCALLGLSMHNLDRFSWHVVTRGSVPRSARRADGVTLMGLFFKCSFKTNRA